MDLTRTGIATLRAKRSGLRETQYFPGGDTYAGEWELDKRHGNALREEYWFFFLLNYGPGLRIKSMN